MEGSVIWQLFRFLSDLWAFFQLLLLSIVVGILLFWLLAIVNISAVIVTLNFWLHSFALFLLVLGLVIRYYFRLLLFGVCCGLRLWASEVLAIVLVSCFQANLLRFDCRESLVGVLHELVVLRHRRLNRDQAVGELELGGFICPLHPRIELL